MLYVDMERQFQNTKPIRGSTPPIIPLGKRSRKHETIEQIPRDDGTYDYAAVLHGTRVLVYHPDNTITIRTNGWNTPSTAKFMHDNLPYDINAYKANKAVWVSSWKPNASSMINGDRIKYPITKDGVTFKLVKSVGASENSGLHREIISLVPADDNYKVKTYRTDRKATKVYHQRIEPFMVWVKSMLAMSDGWLMHETRKNVLRLERYSDMQQAHATMLMERNDSIEDYTGRYATPLSAPSGIPMPACINKWMHDNVPKRGPDIEQVVDWFCNLHEDDYLLGLCILASRFTHTSYYSTTRNSDQARLAELVSRPDMPNWPIRFWDIRVDYTTLRNQVFAMIRDRESVKKIVEASPDHIIRTDVVLGK